MIPFGVRLRSLEVQLIGGAKDELTECLVKGHYYELVCIFIDDSIVGVHSSVYVTLIVPLLFLLIDSLLMMAIS